MIELDRFQFIKKKGHNQITGVRYWGTQGSTNGIDYNTERFGSGGSRINPARFYLARTKNPRDQADYDWALGSGNTKAQPSHVDSGVEDLAEYCVRG